MPLTGRKKTHGGKRRGAGQPKTRITALREACKTGRQTTLSFLRETAPCPNKRSAEVVQSIIEAIIDMIPVRSSQTSLPHSGAFEVSKPCNRATAILKPLQHTSFPLHIRMEGQDRSGAEQVTDLNSKPTTRPNFEKQRNPEQLSTNILEVRVAKSASESGVNLSARKTQQTQRATFADKFILRQSTGRAAAAALVEKENDRARSSTSLEQDVLIELCSLAEREILNKPEANSNHGSIEMHLDAITGEVQHDPKRGGDGLVGLVYRTSVGKSIRNLQ